MGELDLLGLKYHTDKNSTWHSYLDTYERFFSRFKNDKFTLLEIGVSNGNSLLTWRDYFPNAEIVGIDIDTNSIRDYGERIKTFLGSQNDVNFLKNLLKEIGKPSIIVDDGSHVMKDILISLEFLWPNLVDKGIYVIEDLHTAYLPQYNKDKSKNIMDFLKERINDLEFSGKGINGDLCGDRQRQYDRTKDVLEYTDWEKSLDSMYFCKSMCFLEKKEIDH